MAEIVNLRRARKAQVREAERKSAEENRARFGRSKASRTHSDTEKQMANRHIDGHKRSDDQT